MSQGKKNKIKAVHEQDLEKLVKSLGLDQKIKTGKILCAICKDEITLDKLGAIIPSNNKILLVCDKHNCLKRGVEKYGLIKSAD